jgi:quercetin dioxygenase-like cupin family protein
MVHIRLSDIAAREVIPGYHGRFVHSDHMTLIYWSIDPGAPLAEHAHPHEQVANVLEGEFELTVEGEAKILTPGDVVVIPSNVRHSGRAITACRLLDVFYPVREDFRSQV